MARETLLDTRIQEVIRVLPADQAEEIRHQDKAFYDGVFHIEFGIFCQPPGYSDRGHKRAYLGDYIPRLASKLAWKDLAIAEKYDFPGLSPKRAMFLGRTATTAAETIQAVAPKIEVSQFIALASGIVGLHGAIIGSVEALKTDENAQAELSRAIMAVRDNFVRPLYAGRQVSYR